MRKVDSVDVVFWVVTGVVVFLGLCLLGVQCISMGMDICRDDPAACVRDGGR